MAEGLPQHADVQSDAMKLKVLDVLSERIDELAADASKALKECEDLMARLTLRIKMRQASVQTQEIRKVCLDNLRQLLRGQCSRIVMSRAHSIVIRDIANRARISIAIIHATDRIPLKSRYTVSKDCSYGDVGMVVETERYEPRITIDSTGDKWNLAAKPGTSIDEYIDRIGSEEISFGIDDVEYDGDHHGIWAYARGEYPVAIVALSEQDALTETEDEKKQEREDEEERGDEKA